MTETIVAIVGALSFLVGTVGVVASWRASKNTSALNLYRETAQAWEGKSKVQDVQIADLEDARDNLQKQITERDRQLSELTGRVQVLQDALTGKVSWDILDRKITEALQLGADVRTEVRTLHDNQTKLLELLRAR